MSRKDAPRDVAASVSARLKNLARERGEEFDPVLRRYGLERVLYRLSRSEHRDRFVLKGATLFQVWSPRSHRATRDLDLLGRGDGSAAHLAQVFLDVCRQGVEDDGLVFLEETLRTEPIRKGEEYHGTRVLFQARLQNSPIPIQIDVGLGDSVVPPPDEIEFPTLLSTFPAPRLRIYRRDTAVAESSTRWCRTASPTAA